MLESQEDNVLEMQQHRKLLYRLTARLIIYYAVLAALIALVNWASPEVIRHLPVGGLDEISNYYDTTTGGLEDALLSADEDDLEVIATRVEQSRTSNGPIWFHTARSLSFAMISALILMVPVSWVYKAIHHRSIYDHSLDETTLVLPAVVAGIVTVVQHSLALAFSLAGIVAGVQFRRALSDTFDTLFIFVAIGVGIASGIKSVEIAVVLTVFFNFATVGVCLFGDGLESQHLARKKRLSQLRKLERKTTESSTQ